ncbi:MAG: hypothetical protein WKF72_05130 [Nocardioidaceae bacterium]
MTPRCEQTPEAVVSYLSLPIVGQDGYRAAAEHVASCPVCTAEYQDLAPLVALLRALPPTSLRRRCP